MNEFIIMIIILMKNQDNNLNIRNEKKLSIQLKYYLLINKK